MKSRMTVAEIAMRLGLGKRTIYATLEAGIMPGGAAGPALDRHAARL
jgi:excisionase family DNA binding protein